MRCDFCGEEIEGIPYQKDGMSFCSLECSDAMESGETIPLGEELLDLPDDFDEDEGFDILDDDPGYDSSYRDEFFEDADDI